MLKRTNDELRRTRYKFRGLRRKGAELSHGVCPRFKARNVNSGICYAACGVAAMLLNLSIETCNLSFY